MAKLFGKFNAARKFDIDTTGFDYLSLEDLMNRDGEGQEYIVRGMYINTKGLYEAAPVVALDSEYVNLPSHLTAVCEQILDDPRSVQAIRDGKCGFKVRTYEKKQYNKTCFTVEWIDL